MIADSLDSCACAFYIEVPTSRMVLLQALLESYEGLATVRTLDPKRSLIAVITTISLLEDCRATLEALQAMIAWRAWENRAEARNYLSDIL